ncbi:hypothetical protein SAMN05216319_3462 [Duganella sp. CF402]|jgi:hypothetical protein|uniref:hypothetical protein n=1 Tax=unclassified Duganella TaxID=2636909 RepID=UPI0008C535A0|nr:MULTISPECIES: hypothetical protein [unclassified Duganella]RZT08128.1 hypothetical protein EV582_0155 [Duganella sp. BK701]SEM04621.1 hypothetical protein SAMN05216319_3462 [Duganella sp. CF402]
MVPDQERRQRAPQTSDTAGWHSYDFIVRQALQVQRDIGTPGAVELLQNMGLKPQVIARVLGPERRVREEDLRSLAGGA